ncbi:MAG: YlxR family protein [Gaiellales bacterium]
MRAQRSRPKPRCLTARKRPRRQRALLHPNPIRRRMAERHEAVRTCIGCRKRGERGSLLRYVLAHEPEGIVAVRDDGRRLPGRGAWLHDDPKCRQLAIKRRALRRALRVSGTTVELGFPEPDDEREPYGDGHVTKPDATHRGSGSRR